MSLIAYREVCADLLRGLDELKHPRFPFPGYITANMDRARWLLAQPTPSEPGRVERLPDGKPYPTPPAEGEVGELVAALKGDAACIEAGQHDLCSNTADQLTRAADLLQQQAAELAMLRRQAEPPVEGEAWSVAELLRRRSAQNPMGSADPTLIRAAELLERLAGELATLRSAPHA